MSLLLDALKRAEEAKRAKAEIAEGTTARIDMREVGALPGAINTPSTSPINEFAPLPNIPTVPADYPVLSLSALESHEPSAQITVAPVVSPVTARMTTSIKPLALSTDDNVAAVRATPLTGLSAISTEETVLAELLQLELDSDASYRATPNTSPATAAYRAARSQTSTVAKTTTVGIANDTTVANADAVEPVTTHTEQAQRDAVKNAFSVKQSTRKSTRAKWVIPVMAGLVLFVGAGSWYVWQEINRGVQPRRANLPNPNAAQITATPATVAITQSPTFAPNTGVVNAGAEQQNPVTAAKAELDTLPPLLPPPAIAIAAPILVPKSKVTTVSYTPREALAKKIEDLPASPPSIVNSVKLRPAKIEANIGLNPTLTAAYAALNRGDYATAKQTYAIAIAQQPSNLDANLGFATAAARSGETEMALRFYRRVLDLDPRNATAAAALLTLGDNATNESSGQASTETALRLLVENEPNVAAGHFALGNLFASERRWREAQQAYFEAARLTPLNADYLYNLAVSLDNLGQTKQAEEYYRRALAALANGQTQFDRAVVEKRLSAIAAITTNNAAIK
jgi:Tfp pilus assembly protein PilF